MGPTDATVLFTDANAALFFLRGAKAAYVLPELRGLMNNGADWWIDRANRIARRIGPVGSAKLMLRYRGKRSGVKFDGVRCDCCNTRLSNPESILAGRGPQCMEDGKRPLVCAEAVL